MVPQTKVQKQPISSSNNVQTILFATVRVQIVHMINVLVDETLVL